MPRIFPSTVAVGVAQYGHNRAEREVLRIVSPMQVGKSLLKRDGVWYCKRTPSQDELDACEHYFLGGHEYQISNALYEEIIDNVDEGCRPTVVPSGLAIGTEDNRVVAGEGRLFAFALELLT